MKQPHPPTFHLSFLTRSFVGIWLLLALPLLSGSLQAGDRIWYNSLERALGEAKRTGHPVMVHVYADWCPNCKYMKNEVYPSPSVSRELDHFITVNINPEKQIRYSKRFHIRGFPTLLFLDPNGYELHRLEGSVRGSTLVRLLKKVYQKKDREKEVRQKLKEDPRGVLSNFQAGIYYSGIGDKKRSLDYFLASWNSPSHDSPKTKEDSLYNAAVISMELEDYHAAVRHWSHYIDSHTKQDEDYASARLYRGVSWNKLGEKEKARMDLEYVRSNHPDPSVREAAAELLASLTS